MVTRLYYDPTKGYATNLDVSGYGYVARSTVTLTGGSDDARNIITMALSAARPAVLLASSKATNATGTAPLNIAFRPFLTLPLSGAQTVSGTVKGQMRCGEGSTSADNMSQMTAYVVNGATLAIVGTLYAGYSGSLASEWNIDSTYTNRQMPNGGAVAITTVNAADGDRILVVPGFRKYGPTNSGYTGSIYYSSAAASDLPEDETTTTDLAPWVEFSTTLTFGTDAPTTFSDIEYLNDPALMNVNDIEVPSPIAWGDPYGSAGTPVPTQGQIWPRGNRT